MKKMKKLFVGLLMMFLLVGVAGCGKKVALTASEFKSKMEEKGYEVVDITEDYGDLVGTALLAMKGDYQIEFYIVSDNEQAITAYNQNKEYFEDLKESSSVETETNLSNNAKYTLTSGGRYMLVARVDNTFIYLDVPENDKSEVTDVIKTLGY